MQFQYVMEFEAETKRQIYFNSSLPGYKSFLEMSTSPETISFSINCASPETLPEAANGIVSINGAYSLYQVDSAARLHIKTGRLNLPGVHEFEVIKKPELCDYRLITFEFKWSEIIVNKLV